MDRGFEIIDTADARPPPLLKHKQLSASPTAWVFQITKDIIVKVPTELGRARFDADRTFYDTLAKHEPSPFVLQSFLRLPEGNFLAFMSDGTVQDCLQARHILNGRVILGVDTLPLDLVKRWTVELSAAVAWLESIGYVHGDLCTTNILLTPDKSLKLSMFEKATKIGTPMLEGKAPWARLQGEEAGEAEGTYGTYGARTEQFAFGSVLYCMLKGYEPYEMATSRGRQVDVEGRLQHKEFPNLLSSKLDDIIAVCWYGRYASLRMLLLDAWATAPQEVDRELLPPPVGELHGTKRAEYTAQMWRDCEEKRQECQTLVDDGLLEDIPAIVMSEISDSSSIEII